MARPLRRTAVAALPALIAASTLLYWLAARRVPGLWIMPDEAIYGVRALALWEHGSLPVVGSSGAGYSALYPAFAGGPLSIGSLTTGYALLKPAQALVMSLSAWPVYVYTRRLVAPRYALLAAALTLAGPLVLMSGFVMTEVLYYPIAAAALLATARAVATSSLRHQALALGMIALAIATRIQGVVLLAVFALALVVDAGLRRSRPPLRRFWPVWSLVAVAVVIAAAVPGVFGAYESAVNGGYSAGPAARLTYDHLGYAILSVGIVPVAALVLLLVQSARGRERDPDVRALATVATTATVLVILQVGTFSSQFAPHLLGRDLAALPPVTFAAFAVWLGRGGARPRAATSLTAVGLLAILVTVPWNDLVNWDAFPDTVGIGILLDDPFGWKPATTVALVSAALLLLFRFSPRPSLLAMLIVLLLGGQTVAAANRVRSYSAGTQSVLVGEPRDWIDRAADGSVAYVYDGDLAGWTVVWEQRFWNPRIDRVLSIAPNLVPGPIPQRQVVEPVDGRLPIEERYAVTNDSITLAGEPVARQARGPNQFGLTLWRLRSPPRLSTIKSGFLPNGDMPAAATVTAFNCAGGVLRLTLLPKTASMIEVRLDGRLVAHAQVSGRTSWHGSIAAPPTHGLDPCFFTISGDALLGSTVVEFER